MLPSGGGHSIFPRDMNQSDIGEAENVSMTTDSSTEPFTISTAAIAFIIVGGLFFIVLVILLFVLIACLCPRNSVKKTFVPTSASDPGFNSESILKYPHLYQLHSTL